ncbi:MAG TPA: DNA (cytosine-5-)-methyltransferase [Acidothermaceae bacterium]|jgi:DNA (cytosine-5)-methyltransferase 1
MGNTPRTNVPVVRGPFVRLAPHADHCETSSDLAELCRGIRAENPSALLVADLFAGAGGLSLGLEQAGYRVVVGADHDVDALATHRHHFAGMALDWDLSDPTNVERVGALISENGIDVLAGGPPCQPFSKAGRSGLRYLVRAGLREPHDHRRDLWRSFLEVVRLGSPRAVIMENVPDMALDREMFILRSIVFELEQLGYTVQERVVDAWRYGVPQFRQRLILVGVRDASAFQWPAEDPRKVTVANAISDLPPVKGGWRPTGGADGWVDYTRPRTAFQTAMRAGIPAADANKVFDHITRPVRDDDERAFELLDSESRYSDLPDHLKRYRDDIFDDKYKRLSADDVSRTITAHIAKDGYWYIHPEQNRTLTVREAARIQTFPDWFRFAGPPSVAFKQIGNAVPPRLGCAVGSALRASLETTTAPPPSTEDVGNALASWFRMDKQSSLPWLHATSPWHVILGELALDRVSTLTANAIWPLLEKFVDPQDLVRGANRLTEILSWIGREARAADLVTAARAIARHAILDEERLEKLATRGAVPTSVMDLARLAMTGGEEPVVATSGALRVAARFQANSLGRKNRNSDGRIAIAKMIGFGPNAKAAQLALLELANDVCTPARPRCGVCPLASWCRSRHTLA